MGVNSRLDMFKVTVTVDGVFSGALWDKCTGGDKDSAETKYNPGGLGAPISLGGVQTTNNVVVSRLYQGDSDGPLIKSLLQKVGKANMSVYKIALDVDGNPVGGLGITYVGVLKMVTPPEVDSESSAPALLTLELSVATVS